MLKIIFAFVCMNLTIIALSRLACGGDSGLSCSDEWLEYLSQASLLKPAFLFSATAFALSDYSMWRTGWWVALLWSSLVGLSFYVLNLSIWSLEARDSYLF